MANPSKSEVDAAQSAFIAQVRSVFTEAGDLCKAMHQVESQIADVYIQEDALKARREELLAGRKRLSPSDVEKFHEIETRQEEIDQRRKDLNRQGAMLTASAAGREDLWEGRLVAAWTKLMAVLSPIVAKPGSRTDDIIHSLYQRVASEAGQVQGCMEFAWLVALVQGFLGNVNSLTPDEQDPGSDFRYAGAPVTQSTYASAWLGEAMSDVPIASITSVNSSESVAEPAEASGNVADAIARGGAVAGPIEMLGGAIATLLLRSRGFAMLLEAVKGVIQSVADTVGSALTAVLPLVNSLGRTLRPLLDAFVPLLLMAIRLNPYFLLLTAGVRVLAPHIQRIAWGVTMVVGGITQTIVGFLQVVRRIFRKLRMKTKGIDKLIKAVKEAIAPLGLAAESAASMAEGLIGAPNGFRLAAMRFMATMAVGGGSAGVGRGFAGMGRPRRTVLDVEIVSRDPQRAWEQLKRLLERQNFRSNGTPLGIVTPFATGSTT